MRLLSWLFGLGGHLAGMGKNMAGIILIVKFEEAVTGVMGDKHWQALAVTKARAINLFILFALVLKKENAEWRETKAHAAKRNDEKVAGLINMLIVHGDIAFNDLFKLLQEKVGVESETLKDGLAEFTEEKPAAEFDRFLAQALDQFCQSLRD